MNYVWVVKRNTKFCMSGNITNFGNDEPWEQLKNRTKKAKIIQLPFTECSEIPILLANLCLHICIWSLLSNQWTDTFSTSNINSLRPKQHCRLIFQGIIFNFKHNFMVLWPHIIQNFLVLRMEYYQIPWLLMDWLITFKGKPPTNHHDL